MSARIRVLDEQTINKIAAGEVIENPASVVKELVENSIDAGASNICVEIQEGGRQLIRISDDGSGMAQDDALLCLERHATSKIKEVEDIEALLTMGFRGEAVPSIAAISKFNLLTSPRLEDGKGTLIHVEGGRILSYSSAARSPGTTIEVKSLFFNVPVRRKFQKSPSTDTQEILKMLGVLALGNPTVQFELISDHKTLLKTDAVRSQDPTFQDLLSKRIESILGSEFASNLHALKYAQEPYELEGYIGSPSSHKPNRTGQYLFINQRAVYSPMIAAAIREGYGTMLPQSRYPIFVIHLRLPGSLVDVNVHPQKKEVRLRQESQLREILMQGVQKALRKEQESHATSTFDAPPFWSSKSSFTPSFIQPKYSAEKWEFQTPSTPMQVKEVTTVYNAPSVTPAQAPRVIATLLGYCLLDPFNLDTRLFHQSSEKKEGGLALLDQRAAHRRIHYEAFKQHATSQESQTLLIPLTLQISPPEFSVIKEHLHLLNRMGFGIREFGEHVLMVDAYPPFIKQEHLQNCLTQLFQDLGEMQTSHLLETQREEQLALAASRASLPASKQLSLEEAQGLIRQLMACDVPSHCPLGKSTCLYFSPEEMGKWFQKISQV